MGVGDWVMVGGGIGLRQNVSSEQGVLYSSTG